MNKINFDEAVRLLPKKRKIHIARGGDLLLISENVDRKSAIKTLSKAQDITTTRNLKQFFGSKVVINCDDLIFIETDMAA